MSLFQVMAGIGGSIAMALVAYFTLQVLRNLKDHREVALSMFFVADRSAQTLELLSLSLILLSVSTGAQLLSRIYTVTDVEEVTHLINLAILATFAFVYWRFADITRKPSDKHDPF